MEEVKNENNSQKKMKKEIRYIITHKSCARKRGSTPAYLDDLFFYYFEELLDQKIEAVVKEKRNKGKAKVNEFN